MNIYNIITKWLPYSDNKFNSCHGFVNNKEWLVAERKHANMIGRRARIVEEEKKGKGTGRFALAMY